MSQVSHLSSSQLSQEHPSQYQPDRIFDVLSQSTQETSVYSGSSQDSIVDFPWSFETALRFSIDIAADFGHIQLALHDLNYLAHTFLGRQEEITAENVSEYRNLLIRMSGEDERPQSPRRCSWCIHIFNELYPCTDYECSSQMSQVTCSVCHEIIEIGTSVQQLSCGHIFHDTWIRAWYERSNVCPLCRKSILGDN